MILQIIIIVVIPAVSITKEMIFLAIFRVTVIAQIVNLKTLIAYAPNAVLHHFPAPLLVRPPQKSRNKSGLLLLFLKSRFLFSQY